MMKLLLGILMTIIVNVSFAQLPSCVRNKCDSILRKELSKKIYRKCIEYVGYEITKKLDTITDNPCEAYSRHAYLLRYKFSFPNQDSACFKLGFVCTGYYGQMHIQSEYFLRRNQSDLPKRFKKNGLKIVTYAKIAKSAYAKDPLVTGKGVLTLSQDRLYWVFSGREPYKNPNGIGAESSIIHVVRVDPYTGKIIDSQIRRE